MKLLVLAHTPPPVHGQSIMVRTLVDGLPAQGIGVHHVNLQLSHDAADIGTWRLGKMFTVLGACLRTVCARFIHGCDTLYYVPAPGKRGALYRDWTVMFFCRIFFRHTVLHWHSVGLAHWLQHDASFVERAISKFLLDRPRLSIVLGESLRDDALWFKSRKIAVVPNGVESPAHITLTRKAPPPLQVLFLGLCSEEKGLFATVRAIIAANRAANAPAHAPLVTLVVAGEFPSRENYARFAAIAREYPNLIRHVGTVHGEEKIRLFHESHCLCLPTRYAAEAQPLVLLEAMAHDLPVIATRWRGIPDVLPAEAHLVEPGNDDELISALQTLRENPPPAGVFRAHYARHFTTEAHLRELADALTDMVL